MAFHILGDERGAAIKAVRLLPASAAVLAAKWVERGIGRVRIEIEGSLLLFLALTLMTLARSVFAVLRSRRLTASDA